ncbi:MAG: glutaredoxin [Bacteriovoracaceae bacterium]|jgi:glutaredoxin 3|nr:glutaredoxin [Bacteriovoracaceae bacterium]
MKVELYYYDYCPYCVMVINTVHKLGIKIDYKNTRQDPANGQYHQEQTGRSTVPCLYIDGKPLFESRDIIEWLKSNADKLEKE